MVITRDKLTLVTSPRNCAEAVSLRLSSCLDFLYSPDRHLSLTPAIPIYSQGLTTGTVRSLKCLPFQVASEARGGTEAFTHRHLAWRDMLIGFDPTHPIAKHVKVAGNPEMVRLLKRVPILRYPGAAAMISASRSWIVTA